MQKTHANFISKEQLMASPSPLWCTAHVTPCGRITSVSRLPSPQHCSTHTALQQQDATLTTAIIKKKKLKIKHQNPKTAVNSCHLTSKRIHQSQRKYKENNLMIAIQELTVLSLFFSKEQKSSLQPCFEVLKMSGNYSPSVLF